MATATKEVNQVKWVGVRPVQGDTSLPVHLYGESSAATPGSQVSIATTSTTILAANPSRRSFCVMNNTSTVVYVKLGSGADTTNIPLNQNNLLLGDDYTGIITGIVAAGAGQVVAIEV